MDAVKYKKVVDDRDHRITGWIDQTLTRDDSVEETDLIDAVPASNREDATFYTNIESAEAGKLKYKAGDVPNPATAGTLAFAVDRGQDAEDYADEFTGSYIRANDGSRIPGTFRCSADPCTQILTGTDPEAHIVASDEGNLILKLYLEAGWTFESDANVPEGEMPDKNYMYFGYWLKSPVVVSDSVDSYQFATFAGGNDLFTVAQHLETQATP